MKTEPNEIWKPIIGYEGLYEVSSIGRIKALAKSITYKGGVIHQYPEIIMQLQVHKVNGYVHINLTKNKKTKSFRVHRLVGQAFIPNNDNLPEINHLDYVKTNNHIYNLQWSDRFTQNQHSAVKPNRRWQSHRTGKAGAQNPASKAVMVFDLEDNFIGEYESGILAAKATFSNQTKVSSCCLEKRKSHNNLKFKFK